MNKGLLSILLFLSLCWSCSPKSETTKPSLSDITESVYASGTVKSEHQYQAFATVSGIIQEVFVSEGDTVKQGTAILSIANETQKLSEENAALSASYADLATQEGKLQDARQNIELAKRKVQLDSALWARQQNLWQQNIGSKAELEQRELAYQNAKGQLLTASVKYEDLKRQLSLNAQQSKKNYQISSKLAGDFTLRSDIDGVVYSLPKKKGELVNPQTALATIGDAQNFVLEMQVDEYDILKINKGMEVLVTMDSYKGNLFKAVLSKIDPIMNEKSKSFLVEARFIEAPPLLYPNVSFEANIILSSKKNALLIPREYLLNDSFVLNKKKEKIQVRTGLKDYKMVEILSGISKEDELIKPSK